MPTLLPFRRSPLLAALLVISGCATLAPQPVTQGDAKEGPARPADSRPPTPAPATPEARPSAAAETAIAADIETPPAVVTADAIFFRRRSAELDAAEAAKLTAHAERLRANPRLIVTLVGHTDDLGSRAYNLAIADQRTLAVRQRLRELGVPLKQIRRRSYGNESAPNCRSDNCRVKMRRVDLIYPKRHK